MKSSNLFNIFKKDRPSNLLELAKIKKVSKATFWCGFMFGGASFLIGVAQLILWTKAQEATPTPGISFPLAFIPLIIGTLFVVLTKSAHDNIISKYVSIKLGDNDFEKLDYLAMKNSKVKEMVEIWQASETGLLAIDLKTAQNFIRKNIQVNTKALLTSQSVLGINMDSQDELSWRLKPSNRLSI